jgi:AGCS family alanine or glycine:cation symporter
MWITALFGMATRTTEALLGVKYRRKAADGTFLGGAFAYLEDGTSEKIGKKAGKILAIAFAVAGMVAAFGIGNMVQANSVTLSLSELVGGGKSGLFNAITGILLAGVTGAVIIGGIKEIGKITEKIVPVMAVVYILGALIVIGVNIEAVPSAFALIFESAFSGHAAVGGFAGATVAKTIQFGVARGIFSNESGLGTGSLAHSAAKTPEPAQQGLVAMVGTFIDTLIVCTLTGLTIILSGLWSEGGVTSSALTMRAFDSALPVIGSTVVAVCSILFGYSTIIGWYYYGEQCTEYLFGIRSNLPYRAIFLVAVFIGSIAQLTLVWTVSDILNGFMAIPNLIGLLILSGVAAKEMKKWTERKKII